MEKYQEVNVIAAAFLVAALTVSFFVYKIKEVQNQNDQLIELLTEKLNSGSEKTNAPDISDAPEVIDTLVDTNEKNKEDKPEVENDTETTEYPLSTEDPLNTEDPENKQEPTELLETTEEIIPTATVTPKSTKEAKPTATVTPKPTKEAKPTATAAPKPTKEAKPTATATPRPTEETKPTATEATQNNGIDNQENPITGNNMIPNVDDLYKNIETTVKAPASIKSIKGINPDLVKDIDNPDRKYFNGQLDSVPRNYDNGYSRTSYIEKHEDIFEYIGEYVAPNYRLLHTTGSYDSVHCTVGSYHYLIRYKQAKVYKFVYCRDGIYDTRLEYVAGIYPSELCDSIDANSTLADFQKVLGTKYNTTEMKFNNKTDLSTADVEHGYVFTCDNGDAVTVFFDENERICDYIYLLVVE